MRRQQIDRQAGRAMGLYGPFQGVAGTVQKCSVEGDAQAIYVTNTSIYDLAVAFKSGPPVTVTSFGGGDWQAVIPSGDRAGIRIPDIYAGSGFPGYVWVLPIDNTGSLALTGATSGNKQFWIATYADAALLPSDYASAQFQNLASQPRIVTMGVPGGGYQTGKLTYAGTGLQAFTSHLLDLSIAPRAAWSATLALYLNHFYIVMVSSGYFYVEASLQRLQYDSTPTLQRQDDLVNFALVISPPSGQNGVSVPFAFAPSSPLGVGFFPFNANTAIITLGLNVTAFASSVGGGSLIYSWAADVDWQSNGSIPPIGQGAGAVSGGRF